MEAKMFLIKNKIMNGNLWLKKYEYLGIKYEDDLSTLSEKISMVLNKNDNIKFQT